AGSVRWEISSILASLLGFLPSLHHFIRPREKFRRECQTNLFRCLQVDHKLELRCLLHRQISRFGAFQDLVHINSRAPIEVIIVRPVGHQAAFIDKPRLEVNCRQAVFDGKLDDPLSFGEKGACGGRHNRLDLLLLCGLKGALKSLASSSVSISSNFSFSASAVGLSSLSWAFCPMMFPGNRGSPTRASLGTASLSTSSLLVFSSGDKLSFPVILPPGRARLATTPSPTGSAEFVITMGMVVVAPFAAVGVTPPEATI